MDDLWKVTANDVPMQVDRRKGLLKGTEDKKNETQQQQKKQRPRILATASQTLNRATKSDVCFYYFMYWKKLYLGLGKIFYDDSINLRSKYIF